MLILLENLPLERDNRVRRQCRALLADGYRVSVIAPRGSDPDPVPGVALHTYPPPPEGRSAVGFITEYAWSLIAAALLTARIARRSRPDAIQGCNPPDLYWAVAGPYRVAGVPFVFDHHDLSPELYAARGGKNAGPLMAGLRLAERASYRCADHVIATNDTVRAAAQQRGRKAAEQATVVRNGPELSALDMRPPSPELRRGRAHLVLWVGVIGVDDGVEDAVRAAAQLVHDHGRDDAHFAFVGEGEHLDACRALAHELGVADHVDFPGWLDGEALADYFATADVALAPDPPGPRADGATMMKVLEYMAAGLPVVARRVRETKVSAGAAAVYADEAPGAYATAIAALLDDPDRRRRMGQTGRARIKDGLSWDAQADRYRAVYRDLIRARP